MDQRENMTDQYLALSYRWGMDHHASCTTEDRLAGFQTGIPWEDIPKTIQDAISITRSLGKQYIWVDALCIIQSQEGNSHDWENEVSRVGAYYQNALLTLSVLDAVDCNEGIFQSAPGARPAFDFEISGCTLTTGLHSNAMKTYSLVPNFPDLPSLIDGSQLQKRGWVVQERLFSSRTVHLGKYFMSWECHEFRAPEWDDTPLPQAAHWSFLSKIRSWLGRSREEQLGREWRRFIEHYSSTSLTKETDRLPAIAAFASVLETQHSQDRSQPKPNYIAGLWQESLLESLAWHRVGYYVGYHPWEESPRGKIHESCRIPSWSWPSAKNRIAFCSLKFEHAVIEDLSQPEDGLPALRLRCAMLQNAFKVATGISSNNEHLFFDHHPDLDGNRVASEGNPKQYSLALLGVDFPNYIGLILEAVHADSLVFRRVGLFKVADGSGYKSWINLWKECIGQDKTKSMDSEAGGLQVSFSLI
ncbi:hypothetical protein G7054_g8286 [Neopestalotiopsis clavispora]|nr:hypothetical protein G7054_g8286 [Neopestalotiopsis clavispora]